MEGIEVLRRASASLARGERVVECVVLGCEGSVARPAGARMLLLADGSFVGTIGGGAPEYLAQKEAQAVMAGVGEPGIYRFDHASTGSVCGGSQLVGVRLLGVSDREVLDKLLAAVDAHGRGRLVVTWEGGAFHAQFDPVALEDASFCAGLAGYEGDASHGIYTECVSSADRAVVFGGGHVGRELVALLANVGFDVTVVDDREYLARPEHFPAAREVICGSYLDIAASVRLRRDDFVCVMTHGHAADEQVVAQALRAHPRYLGCMGSRKKRAVLERVLRDQGFSDADLASVELPIGLEIGAVTPPEIAVSIVARILQVRSEGHGPCVQGCPSTA